MAKKKKLNKRVVILLVALGAMVVVGLVVMGLYMLPKDAAAAVRAGDKAFEDGKAAQEKNDNQLAGEKFAYAQRKYKDAIGADKKNPDYPYKLAELEWRWVAIRTLPEVERQKHARNAMDALTVALLRQPNHVPSLQLQCDIRWLGGFRPEDYIEAADKVLEVQQGDDKTYFRRAVSRSRLAGADEKYLAPADEDFRKAISLKPEEVAYWQGYLSFIERFVPAKLDETFARALERNPSDGTLHILYGSHLYQKWVAVQEKKSGGPLKPGEEAAAEESKKQAKKMFETAISKEPKNPNGRIALGKYYILEKDPASARKELEEARTLNDTNTEVHAHLATVYSLLGDGDKALASLRKALETVLTTKEMGPSEVFQRPIHMRASLDYDLCNALIAKAVLVTGDQRKKLLEEARKYVDDIAALEKLDPAVIGRAFLESRIAYLEGKSERDCMRILEQALDEKKADRNTVELLVNFYLKDYPGKAEKLIEALPKGAPSTLVKTALLQIKYRQYAAAEENIKRIPEPDKDRLGAGNIQLALNYLTGKVTRLPPELKLDGQVGNILSRALLEYGERLWLSGRQAEAAALTSELQTKMPDNKEMVAFLVAMYNRLEKPDKARDLVKQVLAAHKGNPEWERYLALLATSDPEERYAQEIATAKAEKDPLDRAIAMTRVAVSYRKMEDFLRNLAEAKKIKADHPQVVNWRFEASLMQQPVNYKEAAECIDLATKANLDGVGGRWYKARLAIAGGRYNDAITILEEALKDAPSSKRELLLVGSCYLAVDDLDNAESTFRKAADDDPSDPSPALNMVLVMRYKRDKKQFQEWVAKARELAPAEVRLAEWQMELREDEVPNDGLAPFIRAREERRAKQPGDVQNILRLGELYVRAREYNLAEVAYRSYFDKGPDKLRGAAALGGFYLGRKQYTNVDSLMQNLLKQPGIDDAARARVYVVYGSLLSAYSKAQALNAYDQAIKFDPESTGGYVAKAGLLADEGKVQDATAALQAFIRKHPDNSSIRKLLVKYRLDQKQADMAVKELEDLMKKFPEDREIFMLRGVAAIDQRNRPEALTYLNKAVELSPRYLEARRHRARAYFLLRRDAEARDDLEAARGMTTSPDELTKIGNIWLSFDQYEDAARLFEAALAIDARHEPAIRFLMRVHAAKRQWGVVLNEASKATALFPDEVYYLEVLGSTYRELGDPAKEAAVLADALKMAPDSQTALLQSMDALIRNNQAAQALEISDSYVGKPGYEVSLPAVRAWALVKTNKPDEADAQFLAALKAASPDQLMMVINQARYAYGDKQAAEKYMAWLKKLPKSPIHTHYLGRLRVAIDDKPGAMKAFEEVLAAPTAEPATKAEAWFYSGVIYQQTNRAQPCEHAYLEALKLRADYPEVINNLAYLYVDELKKPEKALPYAAMAEKIAPRHGHVLDTYGWTLVELGQYPQAEDILKSATKLAVGTGQGLELIHYHLGMVYEKTNRLNEAVDEYRKARELAKEPGPRQQADDALNRVKKKIGSEKK